MIEMLAVESSNILELGYDEPAEVLYVTFKSGATYTYDGVPYYAYEELLHADSIGQYFNKQIKTVYPFIRI